MSIQDRARDILRLTLKTEVPAEGDVSRESFDAWDSLKHVDLIFALEDEFDVQFSEQQMADMNSLAEIFQALKEADAS